MKLYKYFILQTIPILPIKLTVTFREEFPEEHIVWKRQCFAAVCKALACWYLQTDCSETERIQRIDAYANVLSWPVE